MSKVKCQICGNSCDGELIEYCSNCGGFICDECSELYEGYCKSCFDEFTEYDE
ncbi:MAG TPA: hypothetical protein GX392_07365 [Clostridiales bacterium]|nr:hypothetical protein [Clostridiales bacterium]